MNLDIYKQDIGKLVNYLKSNNIKDIEIYLEDSYKFICIFFASISLNLKPKILMQEPENNQLNDIFNEIESYSFSEFAIDKNSEFYIKTSGSSGIGKDIKKTINQMINEAVFLADELEWGDEFLASVSHQHMFGLTFKIFLPIMLGKKINYKFLNYPEFIYELNLENKTLISSPTILNTLAKNIKKNKLKNLKNIVCAGGFLNKNIAENIRELTKLTNIYGSTETGVIAKDEGKGFVVFDNVDCAEDDRNTLLVNSPWCHDFQTNDLVEINGKNIKLLGRFDRTIKLNEKRINLDFLEQKIKDHDFIEDCISGILCNKNRISIGLVLSKIGEAEFRKNGKKSIITSLKTSLKSDYKNSIRHIKILSNIKRSSVGKFKKVDFEKLMTDKEKLVFETINLSENRALFKSYVSFGLFYFSGHFMDFPLLPGFVQLESVVKLARKLNVDLENSTKFEAIKFNSFLRPGDYMYLDLEIKNSKLYFSIKNDTNICASGRICIN